jgi:Xaa-Pro aminopeptidase
VAPSGGVTAVGDPPFDRAKLDRLLDEASIDVVVATSRHNVRYLLGSYSHFHRNFDAIGADRYLPAVGYRRGEPDDAFAVGAPVDRAQHEFSPPWVPTLLDTAQSAQETAGLVAERLRASGLTHATVAIEGSFAPHRFVAELQEALPGLRLVEAGAALEMLRAVKRPEELAVLREAAESIVAAMAATVATAGPGTTKRELAERLREQEELRGVAFDYCLTAMGTSMNRAPSDQAWREGEVLSLDSGGERDGYIGDLCRMAVLGSPSAAADAVLQEVRAIQDAAREPIGPGRLGHEIGDVADERRRGSAHAGVIDIVAHGMGLVTHEPPRLDPAAPPRRAATHHDRPLEAGMVLSIETTARVEGIGFVKLEDTVVVTDDGWEAFGDDHRDWLVAGT